jgi:acyl-CoA synthetase (AMP-forming)/AMP-acid ligase II
MHFNLADLFECVVDTVPANEALVCGDRRLTYIELDERANRLAHWLRRQGLGVGDHVGLYLWNGTEYLEGMLACFKIRAVPINVNFRYLEEELAHLFDDADLVALIHHQEFTPRIQNILGRLPRLKTFLSVQDGSSFDPSTIGSIDYEDALASGSPARGFPERSPDDRYIIYTGGTTGMPKGVVWRQEDIFFGAMGGGNATGENIRRPEELPEIIKKTGRGTSFPIAPLMHNAAQWTAFISLFEGQRVVLSSQMHFDPEETWRLAAREKVNVISIVGDAMGRPLAEALQRIQEGLDLSALVVIGSGGAVFSQPVKAFLKRLLPRVVLVDGFGASETGLQGVGLIDTSRAGNPSFTMSANSTVFDEDNTPIQPGSEKPGRLAMSGHIPLGYYGDETKTAATFVTIQGRRWVLPGDIGTVEKDGTIRVLGRGSTTINSGGEKIFPEEVEATLKSHPAVFDALVVGVPDERFGQRIAAVVQARAGMCLTLDDVAAHVRTKIAGFKVPRELHLVDQIARAPSGKPNYLWAQRIVTDKRR